MGKHIDTLTIDQRASAKFYYLISIWPALLAISVPKVAVASLIIRIFNPDAWTRTIMSAVVCIGVANYVLISALSTFMCRPVAAAWDPRVPADECVSAKVYLDLCYFASCVCLPPRVVSLPPCSFSPGPPAELFCSCCPDKLAVYPYT
jgi:hypothetical protein